MTPVDVHFVGSGDAFGSGGRLQTCIAIRAAGDLFLVDCGATSLVGMRQQSIELNDVSKILITHLHGDHFGGLPFFLLDAALVSKRSAPLTLVGPPGLKDRLTRTMECLFPGSSDVEPPFDLRFLEIGPRAPTGIGQIRVTAFPAAHSSGAPSYSLRVEVEGKVFVYSGDTQWTDTLLEASADADLFVCECYAFDREVPLHNDYRTLARNRSRLTCRRLLITHMSDAMLAHVDDLDVEAARDGMTLRL